MRIYNRYKKLGIQIPEEKVPKKQVFANVELKTDEEITNFIRGRLNDFYSRKFNYPNVGKPVFGIPKLGTSGSSCISCPIPCPHSSRTTPRL